jgi:hypothetical protein
MKQRVRRLGKASSGAVSACLTTAANVICANMVSTPHQMSYVEWCVLSVACSIYMSQFSALVPLFDVVGVVWVVHCGRGLAGAGLHLTRAF